MRTIVILFTAGTLLIMSTVMLCACAILRRIDEGDNNCNDWHKLP